MFHLPLPRGKYNGNINRYDTANVSSYRSDSIARSDYNIFNISPRAFRASDAEN